MSGADFRFDPGRGFGVYLHWPYCARICPYCDFNVYAAKARDPEPMVAAILSDLEGWRALTGARRVDSVFLGGGTPSLLPGREAAQLIEAVDRLWGLASGAEITLEANPDDAARFGDFAKAGVGRLSLGVQALRDDALAFLGRTHSTADALRALEAARAAYASVSIDLIYARPGQGVTAWTEELAEALSLGVDHLSLYQLTIEPQTPFGRQVRRGAWTPAEEDPSADLYELTQALCAEAGFAPYEISNHARTPAHESRHNRIYWACGDWVGAGPGAHGRLTADGRRLAVEALRRPADYMRAVAEHGVGWGETAQLSPLEEARERVAMGLRVAEGLAASSLDELGQTLDPEGLQRMSGAGLIVSEGGRWRLTPAGRLLADRAAAEISP